MEITLENMDIEFIRTYIKRAFWRLQYKVRKQNNTEIYNLQDNNASESFDSKVISKLDLENLVNKIPSEKARYVIIRTIIQGATEKEVAKELKISQQAVHKCKVKISA